MKNFGYKLGGLGILGMPMLASAQFTADGGAFGTLLSDLLTFSNDILIPFIIGIGFLVFVWGMFKFFILGGHDDDKRSEGKNLMIWAVVGFVMMVSIFGIVNLIADGLGFSDDQDIKNIPNVPTSNQ